MRIACTLATLFSLVGSTAGYFTCGGLEPLCEGITHDECLSGFYDGDDRFYYVVYLCEAGDEEAGQTGDMEYKTAVTFTYRDNGGITAKAERFPEWEYNQNVAKSFSKHCDEWDSGTEAKKFGVKTQALGRDLLAAYVKLKEWD